LLASPNGLTLVHIQFKFGAYSVDLTQIQDNNPGLPFFKRKKNWLVVLI